ncbi:MAG TPA: MFS transporter [Candidatus Acidoferrales bacterium]|nr:MFS transporter [Candidatus Acidoferrales bacterium]
MTPAGETAAPGKAALISARLDRLPTTRYIWKLLLLLSLGGCFEFYDLFLMTYIGPGLTRSGLFSSGSASFFGLTGLASFVSATFAGLFIGTLVFGFAADKFGRRTIFTYSLLWYTAGSIMMAFQTNSLGILAWRLITGIGIGVELVTIDTYIAELMPRRIRGRAFTLNQVVQFTAIPVVALISWLLVTRRPFGVDGWRWVVLIGSVAAVFVWFIRRSLPESPRWLIARGRWPEAERIVADIEKRVAAEYGKDLPAVLTENSPEPPASARFIQIFRPPYLRRTVMLMAFHFAQTIGYYGFASWVPTLLIAAGIHTTASLQYSFVIAVFAPIGPLLVYRVADKLERKWQIVWSSICIAGSGLLFARQHGPGWLIVLGVILTCSNNWMSVAFHTYQAELFPTPVRAQAVGFVYSWSRFSAIFTSLMIGFFLQHSGVRGVFAFIAGSMLLIVFVIGAFGPRTRGLALESI